MKHLLACSTLSLLLLQSCASTQALETRDAAKREALMGPLAALAGRWQVIGGEEPSFIEFSVSSADSVVREIMFPGTPTEMTNMYTLDGNALVMTHYCAAGNQPHMRASQLVNDELSFVSTGVSDLETPDSLFMASMTLTFVDADHITESWKAVAAGETTEMPVFRLERVKDASSEK